MRIETENLGGVTLVRMRGSIQSDDNRTFAGKLADLRQAGALNVVVDAGELEYINSRAIADLVMFYDSLQSAGGRLALAALGSMVEKVVRAVGLAELVRIYGTASEAVEALSGGGK